MVEGFKIIAEVDDITTVAATDIFSPDITFTDTPNGFAREIQIQVYQITSSKLFVEFNGDSFAIDNSAAVEVTITFTILVRKNDTLNFQTEGIVSGITIIVAGG